METVVEEVRVGRVGELGRWEVERCSEEARYGWTMLGREGREVSLGVEDRRGDRRGSRRRIWW